MAVKYTFYIGLFDKDSKVQQVDTLAARDIIVRVFEKHGVGGATLTSATGVYTHSDGTTVVEPTILVHVFVFGEPLDVAPICEDIKTILNQESVVVEKTETDSALY